MPIPLLAIGGSLLAGMMPGIISSLAGAKTESEARTAVKPQYDAMVAQLVGRGMPRSEASAQADEAIKAEVQKSMSEGALPGWAEALLGVAGGIGGWAAGAKLAAKGAKAVAGKVAEAAPKKLGPKVTYKAADKSGQDLPAGNALDDFHPTEAPVTVEPPLRKPFAMLAPRSATREGTLVPPDGGTMKMSPDEVAFYLRKERGRATPQAPIRTDDPELMVSQGLRLPFGGSVPAKGGDAMEDAMYDLWESKNA